MAQPYYGVSNVQHRWNTGMNAAPPVACFSPRGGAGQPRPSERFGHGGQGQMQGAQRSEQQQSLTTSHFYYRRGSSSATVRSEGHPSAGSNQTGDRWGPWGEDGIPEVPVRGGEFS